MRSELRSNFQRALGALVAALLLAAPGLQAQQTGTVTGQVTDARTGSPVASVQVYIAGLDIGVLTQQNGRYLLQNVPAGTHTLTAERIGYRTVTQEVSVGAGETVVQNFTVSEEALQLDEVVVTGTPGGTQRRAIGNAVTQVEVGDVTEQVAISNMQDLLSGRATGVDFSRLSGNVGTGSPIMIRGVGSFNLSTDPIIMVDGVRVNNSSRAGPTLGTSFGQGDDQQGAGSVNVLDDFNPEDIQSIEVIKGPAAATLYGTEASAGVIQIITKKGEEGDAQFSASIRQGTNFMRDPAGRLGQQWTCENSASPPCREGTGLVPYNMYDLANQYIGGEIPQPTAGGADLTQWPTNNLYQYGHTQAYNLDVRGGTQNIDYFLSANYEDEEGIVWFNQDETFRLRANVGVVFSENWTLDVSTGYTDGDTRFAAPTVSDGGIWQDMVWSNGFCQTPLGNCPLGGFQEHLPTDVAEVEATRDYSRFTGSTTLRYTYGDWLNSRAVLGLDKGWDTNRNLFPLDPTDPAYTETVDGQMTLSKPITTNWSIDWSATADFDVTSSWGSSTSVGFQYYIEQFEDFQNTGRGFASPLSTTINQTSLDRIAVGFDFVENKSLGLYVQEEVSWNDRIFVTGAVRFDDNSAFGSEFSAETYPKVSATYVISEESFWNVDAINSLRLRGAWGQAGRQPDAFAGTDIFRVVAGPGGGAALAPDQPGNPEVGPETSTELEVGFDVALLDDRISGEFTYFSQKNEDALLGVPIPPSIGFPGSRDQNVGRIDSWGWEASLNSRIYQSQDLSFDLTLRGDFNDNEIKELGGFPGSTEIKIGLPYPTQENDYLVEQAQFEAGGAFSNALGEQISAMCDPGVNTAPEGEDPQKYATFPGGDLVPCESIPGGDYFGGRAFHTHSFSVAPTVSLMGNSLQIFALAEGKYGKTGQENGLQWGHIYNNTRVSRTEDDPLWVVGFALNDERMDQNFDADFWKLRELGVRYSFPASLTSQLGAERASLSVSGRELWTIWRAQDEIFGGQISDPEYGTPTITGDDNFWETPPLTSISATLRVTF